MHKSRSREGPLDRAPHSRKCICEENTLFFSVEKNTYSFLVFLGGGFLRLAPPHHPLQCLYGGVFSLSSGTECCGMREDRDTFVLYHPK